MATNSNDPRPSGVDEPQIVDAARVKQGRSGRRIVLILVCGLLLTAIGFAFVYMSWNRPFAATDANDGDQAVDAAAFQTGDRRIPQASAPTTSTGEPTHPPTGDAPNVNAPVTASRPSGQ